VRLEEVVKAIGEFVLPIAEGIAARRIFVLFGDRTVHGIPGTKTLCGRRPRGASLTDSLNCRLPTRLDSLENNPEPVEIEQQMGLWYYFGP